MRIAINGFGRIGRSVLRAAADDDTIEVVAINDRAHHDDLAYLLTYDSVYGRVEDVSVEDSVLRFKGVEASVLQEDDPARLPWDEMGVDVALECTGAFRTRDGAAKHLAAGAGKVLISAPPKSEGVKQLVYGVNEDVYDGERVVSNASCTTNCVAPMARVLHDRFGIRSGLLTTVHSYTGSQRLIDGPAKKTRRGRAAAENIVPTTTGAANAVTEVIPALDGKLDGMAVRVPTPNGSITDLVVDLDADADADAVNRAFREASENALQGVLGYSEEDLVSRDILQTPQSVIVDAGSTRGVQDGLIKVLGWYDNEYGFANRMLDVAQHIHE